MKRSDPALSRCARAALLGLSLAFAAGAASSATIEINNLDGPGEGFNDPTPVAPVGGNPGTTLGEQRLIAFEYAANIWGAELVSDVPIIINAAFNPLSCSPTGAVLGSAGATEVYSDFPGAAKPTTWYAVALANKIAGADLTGEGRPQINAQFNSELGKPGCLDGTFFYLGLDGDQGTQIDFVATLLHEMGHGLGFQTFTGRSGSTLTGAWFFGQPSIWDHFLQDNSTGKFWADPAMTDTERAASAVIPGNLAWTGPIAVAAAPDVLAGTPELIVLGRNAGEARGKYAVGTASFGPAISKPATFGQIGQVIDQPDGTTGLACDPLSPENAAAVAGRIALVDRGVCGFTIKVKNAQDAGAKGVLVADNAAGSPPPGLGGSDPSITIPAVRITLDAGIALKAALSGAGSPSTGVLAVLRVNSRLLAGADAQGRPVMYTPSVFAAGSSISHWDVSASPNLLMEPSISADLTQSVKPPEDLTLPLFNDIGW
jgi:hypothetical protein